MKNHLILSLYPILRIEVKVKSLKVDTIISDAIKQSKAQA